jgi:GH18 family chitinase
MKKSDGLFLFRLTVLLGVFLVTGISHTVGQVNTGGTVTTLDHNKHVIGYVTQWDPWKSTPAGVPSAGSLVHLNIDYSKYTILNYSFFREIGAFITQNLINEENRIIFDGKALPPGLYFYEVDIGRKKTYTGKVYKISE